MKTLITLQLRAEDAEPILREAAHEAAEFGSLLDHVTRKTGNLPSRYRGSAESFEAARKRWHARYAKAKRVVVAFGVEVEPVSEAETLTLAFPYVGGKTKIVRIGGIGPVGWTSGSQPDYKNPYPAWRGGVHTEACVAAADRLVRRWREALDRAKAA